MVFYGCKTQDILLRMQPGQICHDNGSGELPPLSSSQRRIPSGHCHMEHLERKKIALRYCYAAGFEIDDLCTALLGRCEIANPLGHLGQQMYPAMSHSFCSRKSSISFC